MKNSETLNKIEEIIGNDGTLQNLSEEQLENLLAWLEENNISVETDMDKVETYFSENGLNF